MQYFGNWNADVDYPAQAIVRSMYDGRMASWISIRSNRNAPPPTTPAESSSDWGLIAVDGLNGRDGESTVGPQGAQGFSGPRGLPGAQGSSGINGMIYTGLYDSTRLYQFQQAVGYDNKVYVAGSLVSPGLRPPTSPWMELPGYQLVPSTLFTSQDITIRIKTGPDWQAPGLSGEQEFTTQIQEFLTGNGMPGLDSTGGLRLVSGSYTASFTGTMTVILPENWNSSSFVVGASGTTQAVRSSSTEWRLTSTSLDPTTVIFYGIQLY